MGKKNLSRKRAMAPRRWKCVRLRNSLSLIVLLMMIMLIMRGGGIMFLHSESRLEMSDILIKIIKKWGKNANILVWKTEKRESDSGDEQCFLRFVQWVCQWVKGYLSWAKTGKSLIKFEHFLTEESYFWYHDKVYILRIITYWREDGDISTVLNFARRTLAMGQNQASVKLLLMNFVKR